MKVKAIILRHTSFSVSAPFPLFTPSIVDIFRIKCPALESDRLLLLVGVRAERSWEKGERRICSKDEKGKRRAREIATKYF